jgi:hypothetical protein
MRVALILLALVLVGCDQTVSITAPVSVEHIDVTVLAKPLPAPVPDVQPQPTPGGTDAGGDDSDRGDRVEPPHLHLDPVGGAPDVVCEKPGRGSGDGNGKGQGDTHACK